MEMKYCTPRVSDALLVNPGIGFIAAPELMAVSPDAIRDSRGVPVSPYKFTADSKSWNHPDSGVRFCGTRWREIEKAEGEFDWSVLDKMLDDAAALGCTSVVRVAPYALSPQEDIPGWLRKRYPREPDFPFWRIDPNTTEYPALWARFVRAFGARYDGDKRISSVDMAIVGAWGEGGGTENMDEAAMKAIIAAYMEGFPNTPLTALLHDPKSLACIRAFPKKVGFRVDCLGDMGGFHGERWSHMLDFYPENIQNFRMGDAWRDAPVIFEACWHMNDWFLQGWDIDYIVDESLKWHISSYNSKGTAVPEQWKDSVARWVCRMGYRFEIHQAAWLSRAGAGERWHFEMLVLNTGVAPCYHNYAPVVHLEGPQGIWELPLGEDIRRWMPDEEHFTEAELPLPRDIPRGNYTVGLGFPTGLPQRPYLALAIEGTPEKGFYPLGTMDIV